MSDISIGMYRFIFSSFRKRAKKQKIVMNSKMSFGVLFANMLLLNGWQNDWMYEIWLFPNLSWFRKPFQQSYVSLFTNDKKKSKSSTENNIQVRIHIFQCIVANNFKVQPKSNCTCIPDHNDWLKTLIMVKWNKCFLIAFQIHFCMSK